MQPDSQQHVINNINKITSACDKCGFSRPAKWPSVFTFIITVFSLIPTVIAIVYPYLKINRTVDDFIYTTLIIVITVISLISVIIFLRF